MGAEACELFGRFFISLLVQATQQRKSKHPVYCYIDECQDYIANDETIASLIDKARKQSVGLIFAHQRLANIKSSNVLDALSNVSIKFAGGNVTDSSILAKHMRTSPEFISDQPALSFAVFIRGSTPQAISLKVTPGLMERMERMSADEQRALQQVMRDRYAVSPAKAGPRSAPPPSGAASSNKSASDDGWEDVVP